MNFRNPEKKSLLVLMSAILLFVCAGFVSAAITSVTVTAPNGAENWSGTHAVTWTPVGCSAEGTENVNIYWGIGGDAGTWNPSTSGAVATGINCSLGIYSWNTTSRGDGATYRIKIQATADASIYDISDNFFTIDNTAPTVNMVNSSFNTTDQTPSITFNFTDVFSSTANCTLYLDGVALDANSAVSNNTNTVLTVNTSQSDASYTTYVNCTDLAGNTGKSGEITIIIDTTGPTVTITNPADQQYLNAFSQINGTATDALTTVNTVSLYIYNGSHYYNETANEFNASSVEWLTATLSGSDWNYTSPSWVEGVTYNVTVKANDSLGTDGSEVGRQFIYDNTAPTVANVSSTKADGSYKATEEINITVTFDEAVTVTGTPQLELELGTTDRNASYAAGTTTTILTFTYTVQSGDTSLDLNYTSTSALTAGTSIKDAAGNDATLTLPVGTDALAGNKALVIDTTAPTVNMINSSFSTTNTQPNIYFNFTDSISSTASCSLYFNDTSAGINATTANNTNTNITASAQNEGIHTVYVNCTDGAGNIGKSNEITVTIDTTASTVSNVSSTKADGSYKAGDLINITVTFDEAVTVTGTPQLELELGTTDRNASYAAGTTTTILTFTYTVQSGDTSLDLNYTSTSALTAGTSIKDAAGNDATLTLPTGVNALSGNKDIVIDTIASTVTNVSSTKADGSYKAGDLINITVTFDEAVTVTGTPQLELELGTTDRNASYAAGTTTTILTFTYTVLAGDTSSDLNYTSTSALVLNGATIKDTAGNDATLTLPTGVNALAGNKDIVIDTTAPTFTSINVTSGYPVSGDIVYVNLTASETLNSITVTLGNVAAHQNLTCYTSDNIGYVCNRTLNGNEQEGAATVTITGTDSAGNQGVNNTKTITTDFNDPSVTAILKSTAGPVKSGVDVWVAFNVSETLGTDPTVTLGGQTMTIGTPVAYDYNYTRTLTNSETEGNAYINISITDQASKTSVNDSEYIVTDFTAPTVVVTSPNGSEVWEGGSSHAITWTATDTVGLAATPITIEYYNGTAWVTEATNHLDNETYSWTVPSLSIDTALVRVNATDLAGNEGNDQSDAVFTIDTTNPTTPVIITPSDQTIDAASIVVYLSTNSTDALNFSTYQVYSTTTPTWTNTTDTNATGFNFTLTQDTNNTLWIRGKDLAGNTGANASTWVLEDSTAPAVISDLTATDRPNDNGRTINLSWSAPTETGSGIAYYDIYANSSAITDVTGLTPVNASVSASATSFNVTTYGNGKQNLTDGESYYFAIVAVDNAGNQNKIVTDVGPTASYADKTITLDQDWNLISTPFIPNSTTITTVLSDILNNMSIVWYYDSTSGWKFYDGAGGAIDTLTTFEDGKGYWVKMSNPSVSLTFTGKFQSVGGTIPKTYTIASGWNLIGARVSTDTINRTSYLKIISSSGNSLEQQADMWSFDNGAYTIVNSADILTRGFGYWLWSPDIGTYIAK